MELSNKDLAFIISIVNTVKKIGFEGIIIESGLVRGMTENKTAVILQTENVPIFEFNAICINRIDAFLGRAAMCEGGKAEFIMSQDGSYIRQINFSKGRTKAEFRASNPITILAPKKLNDSDAVSFTASDETIALFQKAKMQSKAEYVKLVLNETDLTIDAVMLDSAKDRLNIGLSTAAKFLSTAPSGEMYSIEILLNLFKLGCREFIITSKGQIKSSFGDLNIIVPKIVEAKYV